MPPNANSFPNNAGPMGMTPPHHHPMGPPSMGPPNSHPGHHEGSGPMPPPSSTPNSHLPVPPLETSTSAPSELYDNGITTNATGTFFIHSYFQSWVLTINGMGF